MAVLNNLLNNSVTGPNAQVSVHAARGTNPNYWGRIISTSGFSLTFDIPEEMVISITNTFEQRFPSDLTDVSRGAAQLMGGNVILQEFTQLMWMNTTPIEIPVTILFDAKTDAFNDVFRPMKILEVLALPIKQGNLLFPPSPTAINPGNKISLIIGNVWHFESVILNTVSSSYDMRLTAQGYPISGQVEVTFTTDRTLGRQDWLKNVIGVN